MNDYNTKTTFKDLISALERANTAEKGEICAKILLSNKLTQQELAKIIDVDRVTIYNWVKTYNTSLTGGVSMPEKGGE